jgi:hypothetical protein
MKDPAVIRHSASAARNFPLRLFAVPHHCADRRVAQLYADFAAALQ